jgi:hypothetical protein
VARRHLNGLGSSLKIGPLHVAWHPAAIPLPYLHIVWGEVDQDYLGVWFGVGDSHSDPIIGCELATRRRIDPANRRGRLLNRICDLTADSGGYL